MQKNKVRYSFRFVNVEDKEKMLIEKELSDYSLKINPYYRDITKYVAVIDLKAKMPYKTLYHFIEKNPALKGRYGVYMYIITKQNNDGIVVPTFVKDVIYNTQGELDFSCGFMN